jgi:hypothetical protein
MKTNWRAAWPFLTAFLLLTGAEIEDIYDASKTTVFQPELVILSLMNFLGILFGTTSNTELESKTKP